MDYETLLQLKIPLKSFYLGITLLILSVGLYLSKLEYYDTFTYKGIANNGVIYVSVPSDYLDTLINGDFLIIAQEKYSYEVLSLGEVEINKDNYLAYQMVSLKINKEFLNNEVVTLTSYAHREKIITKLKKLI